MADVSSMDFRILGSLEVIADDRSLELGPFKQRALLALLTINAGRVVSTDRILEALWGEDGADKENALWIYVSRLRSALEPDREGRGQSALLVRRDPGYVLTIDPGQVDARRFEEVLGNGRDLTRDHPEEAIAQLDEGLSLWRGEALEDFTYEEFAAAEIERLSDSRLDALETRMGAALSIGESGELVGRLEALVREHPFRERLTGQLMVALYRSGRQAEALRAFERHKRSIGQELGIEPSPELVRLEEQILLHDPSLASKHERGPSLTTSHVRNPYKGLLAFREDDAADFYGRERLIAEVLRRMGDHAGLIALVGPSGSGKSSIVGAGVLPRLRKGGIDDSDLWQIATMVPGAHPYAELEIALLRSTIDPPDSLASQLDGGDDGILRAALRVMSRDDGHLVLVIDQFEELFALVDDPAVTKRFLNGLLTAVDDTRRRITVLLTLRADFYDKPLLHPAFGARLGGAVVNVTPMTTEELGEAAEQPAAAASVALEGTLLAQLVADVVDQPGALPMFQYTLTELFERRSDSVLLAGDYLALGGVRGAITDRADDVFDSLAPEEQGAARQLFLRLVAVSDDDALSRRRVPASEITSLDVDVVALQTVIGRFGEARLLSFDRDRTTGTPTVEVGHEALLTEWQRLSAWIREARQDLRRHASFTAAVGEWERSGHNPDYLVRGTRLAEFEKFASSGTIDLNAREMDYLGSALRRRADEVAAEEERAVAERRLQRRAKRRLWGLVGLAGVAAAALAMWLGVMMLSDVEVVAVTGTPQPGLEEDPGSYAALVRSGFEQATAVHDFESIELHLPMSDFDAAVGNIAAQADLVVASSIWRVPDAIVEQHPDTTFVTVDRYPRLSTGLANDFGVAFALEEGGFMAGAAAAMVSETGTVGFIGCCQFGDAIDPMRAGFVAGARHVDPEIEVISTHASMIALNSTADFEGARAAAENLYGLGADVVFEFIGQAGAEVVAVAREQSESTGIHRWVIAAGDGTDRSGYVSTEERRHLLFSVVRGIDALVFAGIDAYMRGELDEQLTVLGFGTESFFLASPAGVLAEHAEELDAIQAAIEEGSIDPPNVPADRPLPPPGFDASGAAGTVIVAEDGHCELVYDGPTPSFGDDIAYEIENRSDFEVFFGGGDLYANPAWDLSVAPRSNSAYYIRLSDPIVYDLNCIIDPYGPDPRWQLVTTLDASG